MAKWDAQLYLSYSQICVFLSSLAQPFNDWSKRNYAQGFSWRPGSASFRALMEEGTHSIHLFVNEPIPELSADIVRAFKVPFESLDGKVEIASVSDSIPIEIPVGRYSLQAEFRRVEEDQTPEINLRFGKSPCEFAILKADDQLVTEGELDLRAEPAT